jgi:hypothetical protein
MDNTADFNLGAGRGVSVATISDEQAKAIVALSGFGTTVVTEVGGLARCMGRVLGTAPHDAVGLIIGDPLRFVRTAIAAQYDALLDKILRQRNVKETQPVSPSLAIPLLRGAYDEGRPQLQEFWAALMASAMDPQRSGRVRLSFTETLKRFDPLDALVLKKRHEHPQEIKPNAVAGIASMIGEQATEVQISIDNLKALNCVSWTNSPGTFYVTNYGKSLVEVCTP